MLVIAQDVHSCQPSARLLALIACFAVFLNSEHISVVLGPEARLRLLESTPFRVWARYSLQRLWMQQGELNTFGGLSSIGGGLAGSIGSGMSGGLGNVGSAPAAGGLSLAQLQGLAVGGGGGGGGVQKGN